MLDDSPTPNTPEADASVFAGRRLSPFENVFWRLAQAGSLNVTTLAGIQGPLDEAGLAAATNRLQARHPLLRVRIVNPGTAPQFTTANVPRLPLSVRDADADDVPSVVAGELNAPIDAERGPLARCTWIRHSPQSHHLAITFHHAIGDGMSGVLMMRDLLRATSGQTRDESPLLQSEVPIDHRLPAAARGLRGTWNQAKLVARMMADDLRWGPPARPAADRPAPLDERRTHLICRVLDAELLGQLAAVARTHQTTVHGALSAASILAVVHDRSTTDAISVKHRTPVNMRDYIEPRVGDDVGMFASMAFYRGRVHAEDAFWGLARNVRTSIKSQVAQNVPAVLIGMLPGLYRVLRGDRLEPRELGRHWQRRTPTTTGLTNLGRIDLPSDYHPLTLRSLQFAVAPGALGDCACTATTFEGVLRWNFLYAWPLFSAERAEAITSDAMERLERAIRR